MIQNLSEKKFIFSIQFKHGLGLDWTEIPTDSTAMILQMVLTKIFCFTN